MENDLHARVQTLARLRRCRIGVSDRWDSSGGTDRHNYLTSYTAPAALLSSANSASPLAQRGKDLRRLLRPRRWPCGGRAADQCDELAALIKKTRSHETIAKCVGLAKRPRSAEGLPFSSSRIGRRPVGNSLDDLIGGNEKPRRNCQTERFRGTEVDHQLEFRRCLHRKLGRLFAIEHAAGVDA